MYVVGRIESEETGSRQFSFKTDQIEWRTLEKLIDRLAYDIKSTEVNNIISCQWFLFRFFFRSLSCELNVCQERSLPLPRRCWHRCSMLRSCLVFWNGFRHSLLNTLMYSISCCVVFGILLHRCLDDFAFSDTCLLIWSQWHCHYVIWHVSIAQIHIN